MPHRPHVSEQYRLIDADGVELARADSIGYFKGLAAHLKVGRYMIQEVEADVAGHPHVVREWGTLTHLKDGAVIVHEGVAVS